MKRAIFLILSILAVSAFITSTVVMIDRDIRERKARFIYGEEGAYTINSVVRTFDNEEFKVTVNFAEPFPLRAYGRKDKQTIRDAIRFNFSMVDSDSAKSSTFQNHILDVIEKQEVILGRGTVRRIITSEIDVERNGED